jgi:predicted transcriptional regulator
MTSLTLKTAKMFCDRANIARKELIEEAQRLSDLCQDPKISQEQKEVAKKELDELIHRIENKIETNRRIQGK